MPVESRRNSLQAAILSYTDGSRMRVSFEQAQTKSQRFVRKDYVGRVLRDLASRAGDLDTSLDDARYRLRADLRSDAAVRACSDGQRGLADLRHRNAIQADAIYRRDLLNGPPFYHFDGDLSGPIAD